MAIMGENLVGVGDRPNAVGDGAVASPDPSPAELESHWESAALRVPGVAERRPGVTSTPPGCCLWSWCWWRAEAGADDGALEGAAPVAEEAEVAEDLRRRRRPRCGVAKLLGETNGAFIEFGLEPDSAAREAASVADAVACAAASTAAACVRRELRVPMPGERPVGNGERPVPLPEPKAELPWLLLSLSPICIASSSPVGRVGKRRDGRRGVIRRYG